MDIGLIFALLAAASFAGNMVYIRKGTLQSGEPFTAMTISVFVGTLFFAPVFIFGVDWGRLWSLPWYVFVSLGMSGVLSFIVGRLLIYRSAKSIGANKTSPLVGTSSVSAVILGVLLLNEPFTIYLVLGVVFVVAGVMLVSIKKEESTSKMRGRGVISGLGGAFCYGLSGVLVKVVIGEMGSPFVGVFIAYLATALVMGIILWHQEQRDQLTQLTRPTLILLVIAGGFAALGQVFRFLAFSYSPVSVVEPLLSTAVLFVFFFSFLLNRSIEVFTWRVFSGMVAIVVGAFLLFQ